MLVILAGNAIAPPLGAVMVLLWVRMSGTPWREIGYVRPRGWVRWVGIVVAAVVLGGALKLVMKALVMPLLGAPPVNAAFGYLVDNPAALAAMLFAVIVSGGFAEETVFRGYLFERRASCWGAAQGRRRRSCC